MTTVGIETWFPHCTSILHCDDGLRVCDGLTQETREVSVTRSCG